MKRLLNTLYILTPGSYLFLQNEAVAVRVGKEESVRVPAHTLSSIMLFADSAVSTPLIRYCGEQGISLAFYSEQGRFYGRMQGETHGNILLRRKQFHILDDTPAQLRIVKNIVLGKLVNSREMLMRAKRETVRLEAQAALSAAAARISRLARQIPLCDRLDSLRGLEGAAANAYFEAFGHMIKAKDADMSFGGRNRRPPEDPVNALLSFLYTLLKNDVQSALEGVGLDPACGFLHTLRPGRPALALDLMEEMRAPLCDRLALALINREQICAKSFESMTPPVRLTGDARKAVLTAWQKRKQEEITHPFLQEKVPIGLIPFCQAQLLCRVLRNELDEYPPFHWR